MVTKKRHLLSIVALALGFATVLVGALGTQAHALSGTFRWVNAGTIVATGYSQGGDITFTGTSPTYRSTTVVTQQSANPDTIKGCTFNATITINADNPGQATVNAQDVNNSILDACDKDALSGDITIANVAQGPKAGGNVNYTTANCNDNGQNGGDAARCNAIKSCITNHAKPQADCLDAYNNCVSNHTKDGKLADADKQACIKSVTDGNLEAANAPVPADKDKVTCAIDGIGWIVCPVVNFLAKIVNAAYSFVSSLLDVQPLLTTGQTAGIYTAWSIMRNFANVAFVIAFLVIIFSQLTSVGISNYGIKRMLPRLVVAAILVNVSYWVCAIAVDLSNILGVAVRDLFNNINAALATPDAGKLGAQGEGWVGIAEGILSGTLVAGAAIYIGLSALLPVLVVALLAIVTVFLVLTLRQALIILLIVISPLAFVAYLLPNTENLFKRWRELFQTLLLMYPIIALIFGASALASTIVMATANGPYKIAVQIMGAGISIIPLALTPIVMRTAGGVLNRFGGFINNPNKGPFDRMRKGAEGYRKNRQQLRNARALNGVFQGGRGTFVRRNAKRQAVLAQRERNYNTAKAGYISQSALSSEVGMGQQALNWASRGTLGGKTKGEQLLDTMAKGGGPGDTARNASLAQALTVQQKLEAEEVTAANAIIKNANLNLQQMQDLALKGSTPYTDRSGQTQILKAPAGSALQTAAIQNQFKTGDIGMTDQLVASSGQMGVEQRQAIAEGAQGLAGKARYYGGGTGSAIAQGNVNSEEDLNKIVAGSIAENKYSGEILASTDKDALTRISKVAADTSSITPEGRPISVEAHNNLQTAADKAMNDPMIKRPDDRSVERLVSIHNGTEYRKPTPTPPPPPPPNPYP